MANEKILTADNLPHIKEKVGYMIDDALVAAPTYRTFNSEWPTNGTIKQFCDAVNADPDAVEGMAYLGELYCSDLPSQQLGNVDAVVEIMLGGDNVGKIIRVVITSGNVFPYHWEYTYWNAGLNVSGWIDLKVEVNPTVPSGVTPTKATGLRSGAGYFEIPQGMEVVELSLDQGTLTDEQYAILSGDNGIIKYGSYFFHKTNDLIPPNNELIYDCLCRETIGLNETTITSIKTLSVHIDNSNKHYLISGPTQLSEVIANPTLSGSEAELVAEQIGSTKYAVGQSLSYLTTAPVAANTSGRLKVVVLYAEPATRYDGYLYIIGDLGLDPVLENNSWAKIRQACELGVAGDYWAVGDTKTDLGTDGVTRTFRIVDMSGLYGKHVVFEQVGLEGTMGIVWDANGGTNYSTSTINTGTLTGTMAQFSSELQASLTDTTVKVATSYDNSTIQNVTAKLFLEAEKEVRTSRTFSVQQEFDVLTTFTYWTTHTSNSDHVKYNNSSTAAHWWLRSPNNGTLFICYIGNDGSIGINPPAGYCFFSPCFSF